VSRFVILYHQTTPHVAEPNHWDLMFQWHSALRTWSLQQEPCYREAIRATALADHRLAYLDYEGPISQNRGFVTRWDRGEYQLEAASENELAVVLAGTRLCGRATLRRTTRADQRWVFFLSGD
jgi:hypothetical protein